MQNNRYPTVYHGVCGRFVVCQTLRVIEERLPQRTPQSLSKRHGSPRSVRPISVAEILTPSPVSTVTASPTRIPTPK